MTIYDLIWRVIELILSKKKDKTRDYESQGNDKE